ncbi:MAG TPA: histone deacetylase [Thermoanaerobaculia bacterium]|nr:histone deacetylase [Thermoanaerobaculia bacterium]
MQSPSRPLLSRLARSRRWLAGGLRRQRVDYVYSERYQVDLPGVDALRGERIVCFLEEAGLLGRRALHRPDLAALRDLRRVHTDGYLESLSRHDALLQAFGLELPDYAVERVLAAQRAMVGGTMLATRLALAGGGIAVNLGGGLHHAFAGRGERFCLFNDIAVAIAELRADGFAGQVLIVDLDLHDDDGTRSLFAADPTVFTFSVHNRSATAAAAQAAIAIELGGGVGDQRYLEVLHSELPRLFARARPDVVYYLAGCDPAADDTLGDWQISSPAMLERDRLVLRCARGGLRELPLVIVLAGGYGPRSWRYSARFLSTLRGRLPGRARPVEPPSTSEVTLTRYRRLARELHATGMAPGRVLSDATAKTPRAGEDWSGWGLTAEDVHAALGGPLRPQRLLGRYTRQDLELILERGGLLERLRQLGFAHPTLELELDNPAGETVCLFGDSTRRDKLLELRLRIDRRTLPGATLLGIEWLLLQNPRAHFTLTRPRLPGQEHPGLGMLRDVMSLLVVACERLQLDGLIWVPARYSVAVQGKRSLHFLRPADEELFGALNRAIAGLSLSAAALAIEEGRVVDAATGRPFSWPPMPMVEPVSPELRARLAAAVAERAAGAAAAPAFRLVES